MGKGGNLCPTNYTVRLTTKTINIRMVNPSVVYVSTVEENKVVKTVSGEKPNNNNKNSRDQLPLFSGTYPQLPGHTDW